MISLRQGQRPRQEPGRRQGILLVLLVIFFVALPVWSEERNPQEFYEGDFAKTPLQESDTSRKAPGSKRSGDIKNSETPEDSSGSENKQESVSQNETLPVPISAGKTIEILSIGAVLNAVDEAHFAEKLDELLMLAVRHDFTLSNIQGIGSPLAATQYTRIPQILARGGTMGFGKTPPEEFGELQQSPVWVLDTVEGRILLEATGPLAKHFNAKGEYIDRHSDKTATPDLP